MVRIRNDSGLDRVKLAIEPGDVHEIELPGRGESRDYFFEVGAGDRWVAKVEVSDDVGGDDVAYAVRRGGYRPGRALPGVPREVAELVAVYNRERSAEGEAVTIGVGEGDVVMPRRWELARGAVEVTADPLVAGIDWGSIDGVVVGQAPADWEPLATVGGQPVIARQGRRLFVGFHGDSFARSSAFVVFWARLLDSLAPDGPGRLASRPPQRLEGFTSNVTHDVEPGYWPGFWERGDEVIAISPPPARLLAADVPLSLENVARDARGVLPFGWWLHLLGWLLLTAAMASTGLTRPRW